MTHQTEPTDARASSAASESATQDARAHAASRRRLLLKGVGRGSALLAATVPLKTLAGQRIITYDSTQCTVSGMQSGVHSVTPGNPTCTGYTCSSWGQSVGNLGISPSKTWPVGVSPTTACNKVLSRCTLTVTDKITNRSSAATLFQVVNQFPSSDDAHWVCAYLNSKNPVEMNFPYSTDQVLNYYSTGDANALAFFRKYTETNA